MDFFRAVGAFILKVMASDGFQIAMTVLTLGVGVKGYMQAKDMLAKGQDIMANKIAAGGKIPVIYGSRRVGAQIVYMDTAGNSSTHLYVVYALSVGECEEIMGETIELSGNSLRDSKQFRNGGYIGSDKISSGSGSLCTANQNSGSVDLTGGTFGTNPALGGYRYVMNLHHGAASQAADPMLRASIGSKWTTAHKLNGVAYIAASYIYDSKGQFRGVPQLTVQVKGKKVFDPRDNSTAWSSNPALCFLDLIQNNDYGKGLATSQINMATFSAAANKADTEVNSPYFNGSAKALTWSGSSGDNFIKVLGGSANVMWWQNKVSELMDVYDANGNGVIDGKEITALQRNEFFSENPEYIVFFNGTLGGNYSSQSGSSLIKSKRFHCNAYIDCNKTVMENSKELLSNMRGIFNYVDGKYELQIEDTGSSTFSINDNHIIADSGISVDYGNKDKKANKVVVEFFNANKRYEMDTATVYHEATTDSNDYTSDDGGEVLELKVEFPHTTSAYIAYNHAKTILVRSRHQTTIQFLGTPEMYKLNVGDITNLTYAPLGFSGKTFRVEALELQPSGLVAVSMLEYFDVYTWTVPPQEAVEALANVPSAYAVKAPTSLAFTDTDNSNTSRPFLAWALPTDYPYYQWRVNVKDSSGNQQINRIVDVNNCDLNFLPVDANYVANITALNSVGVESTATALTFTVGDAPTGTPDIKDSAIVTNKLGNGAVTNVKVNDLSAAKINTGELNLGTANGMAVKQGKSGYTDNSTTGLWLGNDGGTTKLNIGSASKYLRFDGTNLLVAGDISASTGTISTSIAIGSGNNIFKADANGIYLGNASFGSAPFKVAMNGGLVATSATITGTLTANNINTSMFQYVGGNLIIKDDAITRAKIVDDAINNALIATDAVNQDSIAANSITAVKIVARAIDASRITAGTLTSASGVFGVISANNITTGTLNATNVAVTNLNASNITTGELNLGTAAGMSVRQNKTGYSSNAAGFWLGNDGGTAKFNIGNSSSFLRWDGSALNIAGSIAATTGVIGGFTVGSNSLIAGSGTSRISLSTAAGIHLGNNTFGSAPFRVSLAGALVATNANISGAITASSLNVTNATITGTLDASVITLNGEPLSNLMSYSSSGTGSITLLEVANIDGDFVVNGNFEATGSQPDLVIGKVYNVSDANDRTIQADARLVSANGDASFKIQSQTHNNATLTTKASFSYTAFGNTASLGTAGTLKINSGNALSLTLDTSQNATFTGEVTADAIQLPVQTPSSTTNKIYNVGGALYFNGAAVGGGGAGDITAVVAGSNLTGGGTSGSVTLNLANAISISGTIASGAITSSGNLLIDSDNAEINLKSGVGTTSGAVNWTFNSTGTDFASIKLPYATRATKGLWIDSGYPITIDATTRIDFDIIGSTKMDLDGSGLSVAGSITSGTIIVTSDNSYFRDNDNVGIYLQTTAQGTGNNDGVRVGLNGTHAFVWNYEAKPLAFATSGTERLSIGATGLFDFKANNITNIGTIASGGITSSGFITGTRLRVGDGTDGYFYSDTAGRTAFRSGEFYIQDTVPTYYNYATNQYHGASSGDNHYFRGNPLSGNNWSIPASGAATFAGRTIMGGDGARVQIANSTAADSSNLYTLAVGSQSGNKSILAARDINTTAGGYQINGTTVIDTARNISAGAITASGLIRSNSSNYYGNASTAVNYRGYGDTPIMSGVSGATYLYAGGSGSVCLTLQSSRTIAPQLAIGQVNNFTTVIDASRNMSNIGTITATGNLSAAGQLLGRGFRAGNRGELHINAVGAGDVAEIFFGYGDGFTEANLRWGISDRGTTNDQLIIYRAPALGGFTAVATFDASEMTLAVANGYKVGTTSVIDAARNITSSQLYIGSWTPSNATSIGRIGKVTDRPAGSITNQLGTNANSVWEIVDYDWTVVLAKVTDAGNFTASGNVTAFSDQRLKTNIQTLDPKLALKMRGVSFTKDEKQGSGVIAQEIEKIAPELVLTADDEIGTKSVAYGNLVGYLIETVKDQQKQIDELKELIGAA